MANTDILQYLRETPHNTNVNVVKGMIGNESGSENEADNLGNSSEVVIFEGKKKFTYDDTNNFWSLSLSSQELKNFELLNDETLRYGFILISLNNRFFGGSGFITTHENGPASLEAVTYATPYLQLIYTLFNHTFQIICPFDNVNDYTLEKVSIFKSNEVVIYDGNMEILNNKAIIQLDNYNKLINVESLSVLSETTYSFSVSNRAIQENQIIYAENLYYDNGEPVFDGYIIKCIIENQKAVLDITYDYSVANGIYPVQIVAHGISI